ncbi:MAG: hypothetical protein R2725_08275 [Solirubrobacterales bacterium]
MKEREEKIDQRMVRALAHPLRVRILEILTERVASPNGMSETLGAGLTDVAYHTRTLDRCGCLDLVRTARKRGATEHFYKAQPRAFIGDRNWRSVPRSVRGAVTAASLDTYMDKAIAALEAGTIDECDDSALFWTPLLVDTIGWEEINGIVDDSTDEILAAETRSRRRLRKTGGTDAISTIFGVSHFETAPPRPK